MNLFTQACKAYPMHEHAPRKTIHKLRASYIKKLVQLGDRWLLHPNNYKVKFK